MRVASGSSFDRRPLALLATLLRLGGFTLASAQSLGLLLLGRRRLETLLAPGLLIVGSFLGSSLLGGMFRLLCRIARLVLLAWLVGG